MVLMCPTVIIFISLAGSLDGEGAVRSPCRSEAAEDGSDDWLEVDGQASREDLTAGRPAAAAVGGLAGEGWT